MRLHFTGGRNAGKSALAGLIVRAKLDADPTAKAIAVPAYVFDLLKRAGISTERMTSYERKAGAGK